MKQPIWPCISNSHKPTAWSRNITTLIPNSRNVNTPRMPGEKETYFRSEKTRFSASNVTHWQTEHYVNQCNKMKHTERQKATFYRLKYGLSASKRPSTASLSTAYKHSKPHYFANRTWQNHTLYNNKGKWDDKIPPCEKRSLRISNVLIFYFAGGRDFWK